MNNKSNSITPSNSLPMANVLALIFDLFKNINKTTASVNESPSDFLMLVNKHLGGSYHNHIAPLLAKPDDQDNDLGSEFIDDEHGQE